MSFDAKKELQKANIRRNLPGLWAASLFVALFYSGFLLLVGFALSKMRTSYDGSVVWALFPLLLLLVYWGFPRPISTAGARWRAELPPALLTELDALCQKHSLPKIGGVRFVYEPTSTAQREGWSARRVLTLCVPHFLILSPEERRAGLLYLLVLQRHPLRGFWLLSFHRLFDRARQFFHREGVFPLHDTNGFAFFLIAIGNAFSMIIHFFLEAVHSFFLYLLKARSQYATFRGSFLAAQWTSPQAMRNAYLKFYHYHSFPLLVQRSALDEKQPPIFQRFIQQAEETNEDLLLKRSSEGAQPYNIFFPQGYYHIHLLTSLIQQTPEKEISSKDPYRDAPKKDFLADMLIEEATPEVEQRLREEYLRSLHGK